MEKDLLYLGSAFDINVESFSHRTCTTLECTELCLVVEKPVDMNISSEDVMSFLTAYGVKVKKMNTERERKKSPCQEEPSNKD